MTICCAVCDEKSAEGIVMRWDVMRNAGSGIYFTRSSSETLRALAIARNVETLRSALFL